MVDLHDRGVDLATTEDNASELHRKLVAKFGFGGEEAAAEVTRILAPVAMLAADEYDHYRPAADARLGKGGKPDWPLLAAAIAVDGQIWSDDVDHFGVGVPVWSSANVHLVPPHRP